jgi:aminoglycoside phosphotransferase (APT) family kinase protein
MSDRKLTGMDVLELLSSSRVQAQLDLSISRQACAHALSARRDTYQVTDAGVRYVVRFAEDAAHLAMLKKEERVQLGLRGHVTLRIPDTRVIEALDGHPRRTSVPFAIHRMIPGEPLVTEHYANASPQARDRLVRDLARFFRETHSVPLERACDWLDLPRAEVQPCGPGTAARLAPKYGKPVWFGPDQVAEMRPKLKSILRRAQDAALPRAQDAALPRTEDTVLDSHASGIFEDTVRRFEALGARAEYMVFGHGDMHGYNIAVGQDDLGPKLVGVFDLENAWILDIHEDLFRLSLVSEPMLEQVLAAYQELDPTRSFDRDRIAIYYRAFLFHLMVGKTGERLEHLKRLLVEHMRYYDAVHGGLPPLNTCKCTRCTSLQ